ncbi:MAG: ribonucleoside-diphosphate reductase subunit alpha, partial [Patescibacteria group bacterium]
IDPRFAQMFSRNKISGKYLDINHNLVLDLKNMGLWEQVRDSIIEAQGDIAHIPGIPEHIKHIYKTSFTTSPLAFIEVAARAQKWVDQALSRNMYLETRDIDETMNIYQTAWEKGVKTTYYLHMKPRHTAEQSTVRVNKAEKMGKRGFAAAFGKKPEVPPAAFGGISRLQPPLLAPDTPKAPEPPAPIAVPTSLPRVGAVDVPVMAAVSAKAGEAQGGQREVSPVPVSKAQPTVEEVLAMSASAGPEDPQDQFICDSCQ